MPRYSVHYVLGHGGGDPGGQRGFVGPVREVLTLEASDRVAALAVAIEMLRAEGVTIFVSPRTAGHPLGFSDEEARQVRERGLPFSDELPIGDAIEIEAIELEKAAGEGE